MWRISAGSFAGSSKNIQPSGKFGAAGNLVPGEKSVPRGNPIPGEKLVSQENPVPTKNSGIRKEAGAEPAIKSGQMPAPVSGNDVLEALHNSVIKGNRAGIAQQTREALASGNDAAVLLNTVLMPAINEVGELFDRGKYFLPQLIASAEAMKASIEYLEPLLAQKQSGREMPVVVIATVEGDIHDIGKNLVALMLKN